MGRKRTAGGRETDPSLQEQMDRVYAAWRAAHANELESPYLIEVFDTHVIVRRDLEYFRVPYTVGAEDAIAFGEPERVRQEYVPVSEALVELTAPRGDRWAVRIIREGFSKSEKPIPGTDQTGRWYYTQEAIATAPAVFDGAPVYAFEFDGRQYSHLWGLPVAEKVKKGMIANLIGYLEHVREADGEALAELPLLADRATEAVRDKLADLHRRGRADLVGLSIDARVLGVPVETREGLVFAVCRFDRPATVDVATHPAAGGAFLRALEAQPEKEADMVKELLAKLRARRPDLAAKLGENPTEVQVKEALLQALEPAQGAEAQEARTELEEARKLRCSLLLDKRLDQAQLPAPVAAKLRKRYDGRAFEAAALEADITSEKEMLDALAKEGKVEGLGEPRAAVVLEQQEKLQCGMDRLFGAAAREGAPAQGVPAFRSFRDAFRQITGRQLEDMLGHRIATAQEAITAALWADILGTSMHRRLIKDYAAANYGEERIASRRPGGVANFKTQDSLRVQYFADLASVDPESADYVEIAAPDDEKVSWAVQQKGNILTITRKTLINDDLGAVTKLVGRLGRAARRTKAKFVWAFAMNNSTYDVDSTAWFHGDHGNLGSTALTANQTGVTTLMAAVIALADMTEPGSGEKLGLPAFADLQLTLAVPHALLATAIRLNQSQLLPDGSNNLYGNPFFQFFGARNERIVVNPLFTDDTDWYLFRDPEEVDSIEIGYLNDQEEPEFFVASVPTIGQMFVADKQQYKVRHEYGGDIVDYRGGYKAVVAG